MKHTQVELLAPAGDFVCFQAAMNAGADAVYLGGDKFGARAYANNFSQEEIVEALRIAHLFHKRIYLTVNTLVKERELSDLIPFLQPLYDAGLDGVIVQDMGVFRVIREHFPKLELHASTQMTITGVYGAKLLKELGACRIVPARELSLAEIQDIKQQTGLELETFIHGAMCYAYSGQCLFSSILGGRSGNRGRCAGPCRLPYQTQEGKQIYPLSLKDMYTLPILPQLIQAGIDSFKIEGRMKSPEYVAGTTAIYRKYIDQYLEHPDRPYKIEEKDETLLRGLYIRTDTCEGYYQQHNGADMVTLHEPGYSGTSKEVQEQIRQKYVLTKKTLPIHGHIRIAAGEDALLTLTCKSADVTVTVTGDQVSQAQNRPLTKSDIQNRISKLGDTCFQMEELIVDTDDHSFLPVKALNELRRTACEQLEQAILAANDKDYTNPYHETAGTLSDLGGKKQETPEQGALYAGVSTKEQLQQALSFEQVTGVYLAADLLCGPDEAEVRSLLEEHPSQKKFFLALPHIMRKRSYSYLPKYLTALTKDSLFQGVLIRNPEELQWLRESGYKGTYLADYTIYAWNKEACKEFYDLFHRLTAPVELNKKELLQLGEAPQHELLLYGRLPLMYSANCVRKTLAQCTPSKTMLEPYTLVDRYRNRFSVIQNCNHCYNILYNTVPMSLHGQLAPLKEQQYAVYRLDFTLESAAETREVLTYYTKAWAGEPTEAFPYADITNGHYKRGVE